MMQLLDCGMYEFLVVCRFSLLDEVVFKQGGGVLTGGIEKIAKSLLLTSHYVQEMFPRPTYIHICR